MVLVKHAAIQSLCPTLEPCRLKRSCRKVVSCASANPHRRHEIAGGTIQKQHKLKESCRAEQLFGLLQHKPNPGFLGLVWETEPPCMIHQLLLAVLEMWLQKARLLLAANHSSVDRVIKSVL